MIQGGVSLSLSSSLRWLAYFYALAAGTAAAAGVVAQS